MSIFFTGTILTIDAGRSVLNVEIMNARDEVLMNKRCRAITTVNPAWAFSAFAALLGYPCADKLALVMLTCR